jgi:hypothetical protein
LGSRPLGEPLRLLACKLLKPTLCRKLLRLRAGRLFRTALLGHLLGLPLFRQFDSLAPRNCFFGLPPFHQFDSLAPRRCFFCLPPFRQFDSLALRRRFLGLARRQPFQLSLAYCGLRARRFLGLALRGQVLRKLALPQFLIALLGERTRLRLRLALLRLSFLGRQLFLRDRARELLSHGLLPGLLTCSLLRQPLLLQLPCQRLLLRCRLLSQPLLLLLQG